MIRIAITFGVVTSAVRLPRAKEPKKLLLEEAEESYAEVVRERAEKKLAAGQVSSQLALPDLGETATCKMSESACAMKDMTETTVVWADDSYETARCYKGDPWAFIVIPGATDKLYYYFPGGGGCFESPWGDFQVEGCFGDVLTALVLSGAGSGVSDMTNPKTGLQGYSLVAPVYCQGGVHLSNTTFEAGGETYYQYGYNSNEILRQWAMANFPGRLDRFVISGSSAGSVGAGVWADILLSSFSYNKATVVLDSYMAIFPSGSQGRLIRQVGACSTPPLANFRSECEAGRADMQFILDYTIAKYPNVAFAHIQSKEDEIQISFYSLIGVIFGGWPLTIDPPTFYYYSNYLMNVYNKHPNYVAYIVDTGFHVFLGYPVEWYSTSTVGPNTTATAPAGVPMLYEWFNDLIEHKPVNSQCTGELASNGAWILNYCFQDLFPKTLQV